MGEVRVLEPAPSVDHTAVGLTARSPDNPRSKFDAVLRAATRSFGTVGYENTKWADIAREVGIGQTALYNYFDSKAHCLFALMAITNQESHDAFATILAEDDGDHVAVLRRLASSSFDVDDEAALRRRIAVAEQGRLAVPLPAGRAEDARVLARDLIRRTESMWTAFLVAGMDAGAFPAADPQLTSHATLGLIGSVWQWYRPGGKTSLAEIAPFFVDRLLTLVLS